MTEWQVVKRIYDWSLDINELPSIRYLFTPNLELYIDYDLRKNEYQIKNTLTGQIECVCPPATLSPRYNNPSLIMK